jgi:hypothetical protein
LQLAVNAYVTARIVVDKSGVFMFRRTSLFRILFAGGLLSAGLHAQESIGTGMGMVDMNPAGLYLMNLASGTSQNPLPGRCRC